MPAVALSFAASSSPRMRSGLAGSLRALHPFLRRFAAGLRAGFRRRRAAAAPRRRSRPASRRCSRSSPAARSSARTAACARRPAGGGPASPDARDRPACASSLGSVGDRLFGLVADDDVLLAADAPPLVGRRGPAAGRGTRRRVPASARAARAAAALPAGRAATPTRASASAKPPSSIDASASLTNGSSRGSVDGFRRVLLGLHACRRGRARTRCRTSGRTPPRWSRRESRGSSRATH